MFLLLRIMNHDNTNSKAFGFDLGHRCFNWSNKTYERLVLNIRRCHSILSTPKSYKTLEATLIHKEMFKYGNGSVLILYLVLKLDFSCLIEITQLPKDRYLDFTLEVDIQSSTTRSHKALEVAPMHRGIPKYDGCGTQGSLAICYFTT